MKEFQSTRKQSFSLGKINHMFMSMLFLGADMEQDLRKTVCFIISTLVKLEYIDGVEALFSSIIK